MLHAAYCTLHDSCRLQIPVSCSVLKEHLLSSVCRPAAVSAATPPTKPCGAERLTRTKRALDATAIGPCQKPSRAFPRMQTAPCPAAALLQCKMACVTQLARRDGKPGRAVPSGTPQEPLTSRGFSSSRGLLFSLRCGKERTSGARRCVHSSMGEDGEYPPSFSRKHAKRSSTDGENAANCRSGQSGLQNNMSGRPLAAKRRGLGFGALVGHFLLQFYAARHARLPRRALPPLRLSIGQNIMRD